MGVSMKTLHIVRAKPNPAGKDHPPHGGPSPTQLAAEWVDFKNTGPSGVDLATSELFHLAFSADGKSTWARVTGFTGNVPAGQVVRVHSGEVRSINVIAIADQVGADHHVFTGVDRFVWNNAQGDRPSLWDSALKEWIDQTSYDPYPQDGAVLTRVGSKLVPAGATARRI